MKPRKIRTIQEAKQIVDERGLTHVKVGLFDNDGIMRGKYVSREKFFYTKTSARPSICV